VEVVIEFPDGDVAEAWVGRTLVDRDGVEIGACTDVFFDDATRGHGVGRRRIRTSNTATTPTLDSGIRTAISSATSGLPGHIGFDDLRSPPSHSSGTVRLNASVLDHHVAGHPATATSAAPAGPGSGRRPQVVRSRTWSDDLSAWR
jgi:hypothetical protein